MSNPDMLPSIPANIASLTSPLVLIVSGTATALDPYLDTTDRILLNWGLFGILSTQVCTLPALHKAPLASFISSGKLRYDRLRNKIIVYGLYILECVQTAMTAADLFSTGFGNMNSLDLVNLSPFNTPILCSIVAWIVQCFYAFRIYMLRRSFQGISILITLVRCPGFVVSDIQKAKLCRFVRLVVMRTFHELAWSKGFRLGEFSRFHDEPRLLHSAHVWVSTGIVCDFLVTSTLVWLLFKTRKESDTQGASARILARLVHLIVQTNVLTNLITSINDGVVFAGEPIIQNHVRYVRFHASSSEPLITEPSVLKGLYSNSLLATLNNRVIARRLEMDDIVFQDIRSLYAPSDINALPAIPPDIALSHIAQLVPVWCIKHPSFFPDDRIRNKILVYGLYFLETVQTAMTAADLCFWFATGFGDINNLNQVNLSPFDAPMVCSIVACIVQCFYGFRIYMLRSSFLWVSLLIVVMSISQLVGGIIVGIVAFQVGKFSKFDQEIGARPAQVWFITGIICDILIAVTLVWLLFKSRKESSTRGAGAQILARLVRLIVQTNVLTIRTRLGALSYSVDTFELIMLCSHGGVFKCTTLVTGKLYSNALLATLNNRIIARRLDMDDIVFQDMGPLYAASDKTASVGNSDVDGNGLPAIPPDIALSYVGVLGMVFSDACLAPPKHCSSGMCLRTVYSLYALLNLLQQIIGILLNWCLFGVLSTQVYVYYLSFPDDKIRNKILGGARPIYGLYVLETVQTAMTAADLCFWFATGFGDMNILNRVNISPIDTPMLCSIIAWIVQCFYGFRIYMLRSSLLWVSLLVVLDRHRCISTYKLIMIRPQVWFITSIICDILIAVTLVWLFVTWDGHAYYLVALPRPPYPAVQIPQGKFYSRSRRADSRPPGPSNRADEYSYKYSNALLATLNNRIITRKLEMDDIVFQDIGSLYTASDENASVANPAV
ncbi:LOW QUALITY PROTEIN: hypothetical protein CVT26_012409 [Gymnopilus dilepis]|uniref:DUF6534 domain-containing protein n=1 Tax=Gymnopilus dilepis TaxID=231916 RepID=A0A409YQI8_9AGAR|nr:LOW QUALITY PROTEIN: hypothetical protein CVT26_012409 [Gymnopilus dilepis]